MGDLPRIYHYLGIELAQGGDFGGGGAGGRAAERNATQLTCHEGGEEGVKEEMGGVAERPQSSF